MGPRPQKGQGFPLVRRTIHTHLCQAFVVVAGAGRVCTAHIEENVTGRAFLVHTSLRGRLWHLATGGAHGRASRDAALPAQRVDTLRETADQ